MAAAASETEALNRIMAAIESGAGPVNPSHLAVATPAVANRFVVSTNMIVGAYSVANGGAMPTIGAYHVTITHTTVAGADTLGTITVTGTNLAGAPISEVITPIAGSVATGLLWFRTVTSVVGAGWVAVSTPDTIVVGVAAGMIVVEGNCVLRSVIVNTAAAGAVTLSDSTGTLAILKSSIAEGTYPFNINCVGYLGVNAAAATDITVGHVP